MAQLPSRTSVMVRSSKALQVLDGLSGPQSCRGGLTARRSKYAWKSDGLHAFFDRRQVTLA